LDVTSPQTIAWNRRRGVILQHCGCPPSSCVHSASTVSWTPRQTLKLEPSSNHPPYESPIADINYNSPPAGTVSPFLGSANSTVNYSRLVQLALKRSF
jgi:hypothetical protein